MVQNFDFTFLIKFCILENNLVLYVLILHVSMLHIHLHLTSQIQNPLCACIEDNKFKV